MRPLASDGRESLAQVASVARRLRQIDALGEGRVERAAAAAVAFAAGADARLKPAGLQCGRTRLIHARVVDSHAQSC
jgi:hypothetical protein